MFAPQKPNNGNGVNVNTKLYDSYSDTCHLVVGGWNNSLSVKFHPFKGVDANGLRQYATDKSEVIVTSLNGDNTTTLKKAIDDEIRPAINDKKSASVSILVSSDENKKAITISTDGTKVYISVAINVTENNTTTPNNILTHEFNTKEYITSYDPNTGSGEKVLVNSDFENFYKKLDSVQAYAGAISHSIKYSDAIRNSYNKNGFNNQQPQGNFNNYNAPVSTGTDMSDFLPFN